MLGWIFRRYRDASPTPHDDKLRHDPCGRPLAPRFPGMFITEDATKKQKIVALEWAAAWTGYSGMFDASECLAALDSAMVGKLKLKKTPKDNAIDAAIRVLRHGAQLNRADRTANAFPFTELLEGSEHSCIKAKALSCRILPCGKVDRLPLPGCDAASCKCWMRQITRREARQRSANIESDS